jgi:hypothetical protein
MQVNSLTISWDNVEVFSIDREISLGDEKRAFIERMDRDMDGGIRINGELISTADIRQRATFVVINLLKALQQENEAIVSASAAWLLDRLPGVSEIHAGSEQGRVYVELVE